ncbi:hypothetical protein RFI_07353, partial [Reticulomyxa filosa]
KKKKKKARYKVIAPSGVLVQEKSETEEGEIEWNDVTTLKYGTIVEWEQTIGKRIRITGPVYGWVWLKDTEGNPLLKRLDVEDPPPWLINMQRFGPPPSYPDLKIPGLNAPIPPGKQYGFHEGQWGKPPVDEKGEPLYGDPFGIWTEPIPPSLGSRNRWGILEKFESDSEEEESEEEEEETEQVDARMTDVTQAKLLQSAASASLGISATQMTDRQKSGTVTGESDATMVSGLTTPDIHLRKQSGIETPSSIISSELTLRKGMVSPSPQALYQVLEPQQVLITYLMAKKKKYIYIIFPEIIYVYMHIHMQFFVFPMFFGTQIEVSGRFGSDQTYKLPSTSQNAGQDNSGLEGNLLKRRFEDDLQLEKGDANEPPTKRRKIDTDDNNDKAYDLKF